MTQQKDQSKLYFIAFVPPAPVFEEVVALKEYFRDKYKSKAALNSPPHVTLHMPFRYREDRERNLVDALKKFVRRHDPVKICLDNYSSFPPRVIFLNVTDSEALKEFQKALERFCRRTFNLLNANHRDEPYHPHMTLAFRDLKKAMYHAAWEEFKDREYKAEFMADRVALLKHNGTNWDILHEFTLESSWTTDTESELATTEG